MPGNFRIDHKSCTFSAPKMIEEIQTFSQCMIDQKNTIAENSFRSMMLVRPSIIKGAFAYLTPIACRWMRYEIFAFVIKNCRI